MKREEYITTINYNGHMINVGMDDPGQQYFLEFVDDSGELVEYGCGSYNDDYHAEIERIFGEPEQCAIYGTVNCQSIFAHGYCSRCPSNYLFSGRRPD